MNTEANSQHSRYLKGEGDIPVITFDGPSASGKGTLAKRVALELGWHFLDSGALYRLLALKSRNQAITASDKTRLAQAALTMAVEFTLDDRILLEGRDVTSDVRREETGTFASQISAYPEVRAALLDRQYAFRKPPGLVADGRDMGTVVFPDAEIKFFLTASAEVRAQRRFLQLKTQGADVTLARLVQEIHERDSRDRQRSASPLLPALDAVVIDSSDMPRDAVFRLVMETIGDKKGFLS